MCPVSSFEGYDDMKKKSTWGVLKNHFRRGSRSNSISFNYDDQKRRQKSMEIVKEEVSHISHIDLASVTRNPLLINGKSDIVSNDGIALLEEALPPERKGYNWMLLFGSSRHGANYIQFYEKVKFEQPTYILVETMKGEVFGGYASCPWKECSKGQYFGTGECFLFKLDDSFRKKNENNLSEPVEGKLQHFDTLTKYSWTGANAFFQYSTKSGIGLGGGGDDFGLFIGDDFAEGCTGRCTTFDNEPLCSASDFDICQVEVWGFTQATNEAGARIEKLKKKNMQKRGRKC
jgi:hypothetical protein